MVRQTILDMRISNRECDHHHYATGKYGGWKTDGGDACITQFCCRLSRPECIYFPIWIIQKNSPGCFGLPPFGGLPALFFLAPAPVLTLLPDTFNSWESFLGFGTNALICAWKLPPILGCTCLTFFRGVPSMFWLRSGDGIVSPGWCLTEGHMRTLDVGVEGGERSTCTSSLSVPSDGLGARDLGIVVSFVSTDWFKCEPIVVDGLDSTEMYSTYCWFISFTTVVCCDIAKRSYGWLCFCPIN